MCTGHYLATAVSLSTVFASRKYATIYFHSNLVRNCNVVKLSNYKFAVQARILA
jgi:hypothetical protein